jgi:hypothetical protein
MIAARVSSSAPRFPPPGIFCLLILHANASCVGKIASSSPVQGPQVRLARYDFPLPLSSEKGRFLRPAGPYVLSPLPLPRNVLYRCVRFSPGEGFDPQNDIVPFTHSLGNGTLRWRTVRLNEQLGKLVGNGNGICSPPSLLRTQSDRVVGQAIHQHATSGAGGPTRHHSRVWKRREAQPLCGACPPTTSRGEWGARGNSPRPPPHIVGDFAGETPRTSAGSGLRWKRREALFGLSRIAAHAR